MSAKVIQHTKFDETELITVEIEFPRFIFAIGEVYEQ